MNNLIFELRYIEEALEKRDITWGYKIWSYWGYVSVWNIWKDTYSIIENVFTEFDIDITIIWHSNEWWYFNINFEINW